MEDKVPGFKGITKSTMVEDLKSEIDQGTDAIVISMGAIIKAQKDSSKRGKEILNELKNKHKELLDDLELKKATLAVLISTDIKKEVSLPVAKEESRVPTDLPMFRDKKHKDAEEFIEMFERKMQASVISIQRYVTILKLCLDSDDNEWFEEIDFKVEDENSWKKLKEKFVEKFKNPNASFEAMREIQSLKVTKDLKVQQYTFKFKKLMKKIGWKGDEEVALFQFKQGLPRVIQNQLTMAITLMRKDGLDVDKLSNVVIEYEAATKTEEDVRSKCSFVEYLDILKRIVGRKKLMENIKGGMLASNQQD